MFALKINLVIRSPERVAHRQKFFRARISLIVRQKIAIAVLLGSRATGDDVQIDASINQTRQGVDLLHEYRRLHQSGAISNNEFELLSGASERTTDHQRIGLVAVECDEDRFDTGFFCKLRE